VTSESTETNDNDLELNAVAYAFSKIFEPKTCWNVANKLNSSFGDKNSCPSSIFPSEANWELKKKTHFFILWKISLSSGSTYEHKNFYGGRKKVHQIDDEARLSWGTFVKIHVKHLSLTSLAFMQLVPGDDRAVRHICIRCIVHTKCWKRAFCMVYEAKFAEVKHAK